MQINYWGLSVFMVLVIALIVWLIKRDRKDEKDFEDELNRSDIEGKDDNWPTDQ